MDSMEDAAKPSDLDRWDTASMGAGATSVEPGHDKATYHNLDSAL